MIRNNASKDLLGGHMYDNIVKDILKYQQVFLGEKNMKEPIYLSTGNNFLNNELKGGYKKGFLTEIAGLSDTGKTLLALKAVKEVQKEEKLAVYIDADRKFKSEYIQDNNLNEDGIILMQPDSIEQLVILLSEIVKPNIDDIGLIVIDSLANLSTKMERNSKLSSNTDIHRSKVIKALLTRIANMVRNTDTCAIILNQLRNKFKEDGTIELVSSSERWVKMTCDTRIVLTLDDNDDLYVNVSFKQ